MSDDLDNVNDLKAGEFVIEKTLTSSEENLCFMAGNAIWN